ncbi:MAG: hypothetical protein KDM63_15885 [Verrucomicrobiae bacterium]|nr:hypothetical protein [Verrucomicrobiae bacterium]MCB1088517.1 hypothetical protein [Verrucomicrobiae bacterium]
MKGKNSAPKINQDEENPRNPVLQLHAPFSPTSAGKLASSESLADFLRIISAAESQEHRKSQRRLQAQEKITNRKLEELVEALLAADPSLPDRLAPQSRHRNPKKALMAQLFQSTPEIQAEERLLKWEQQAHNAVGHLFDQATEGYGPAIKAIARLAETATIILLAVEKAHPTIVSNLARSHLTWPALISAESNWVKTNERRIADLNLGADLTPYRARFRRLRGANENRPARIWAMTAVRTLEETKYRMAQFRVHSDWIVSEIEQGNFGFESPPPWFRPACLLPPFDQSTYPQWFDVIREMIREQQPDFHDAPEWSNQRNSLTARGKGTKGVIQNAILDDIGSALKQLAPNPKLPN